MNFALSEEQQMLQASANEFVKRESSLKRIRELREDATGFSREIWGKMAELGSISTLVMQMISRRRLTGL